MGFCNALGLLCASLYSRCEIGFGSFFFVGLNPIESVWARPRRDLAVQEMEDLQAGRSLSTCQYKRRASLHLTSYGVPQVGESISYLSRLLRGMPRRLAKCKANRYGPCGK